MFVIYHSVSINSTIIIPLCLDVNWSSIVWRHYRQGISYFSHSYSIISWLLNFLQQRSKRSVCEC